MAAKNVKKSKEKKGKKNQVAKRGEDCSSEED